MKTDLFRSIISIVTTDVVPLLYSQRRTLFELLCNPVDSRGFLSVLFAIEATDNEACYKRWEFKENIFCDKLH